MGSESTSVDSGTASNMTQRIDSCKIKRTIINVAAVKRLQKEGKSSHMTPESAQSAAARPIDRRISAGLKSGECRRVKVTKVRSISEFWIVDSVLAAEVDRALKGLDFAHLAKVI